MKRMVAVIGAGYGDEGKGFITSGESRWSDGKVLNVLYNGGVQRGHTVLDHVFHCFGSGTFAGADTYYDQKFLVNPIGWLQERDELRRNRYGEKWAGHIFVHENCRVTTPYDMILNQLIESDRGEDRHGSCGLGIWETTRRHEKIPVFARDLFNPNTLYEKLKKIESYFRKECKRLKLDAPKYVDVTPFMMAADTMSKAITMVAFSGNLMKKYDVVIFEGGQGLMLDEENLFEQPNVTASSPGLKYIAKYFEDAEVYMDTSSVEREVIYVTRSYATRHGAGRFKTECDKAEINPYMEDHTNKENEWQGPLRYGRIDASYMSMHISMDLKWLDNANPRVSLAVTQLNLTDGMVVTSYGTYPPEHLKFHGINEVQKHYYNDLYWVKKHRVLDRMKEIEEVLG